MRTLVSLCLVALGCACAASAPSTPEELETALQAHAQTVLHLDAITLYSPYEAEATERYAGAVVDQAALVRPLFADSGEPPVRFYLVPAPHDDAGAPAEIWNEPSRDDVKGAALGKDSACVYVRAQATPNEADMRVHFATRTIRHELAHVHARRAGLGGAPWFNEGLAKEVETMRAAPDGLVPHRFPAALVSARQSAEPGTVRNLLEWKNGADTSIESRRRRYCESQALFRFLSEHAGAATWIAGARAAHDLDEESILALEPAWLQWLGDHDPLEAIRSGTRSSDASVRTESASWLPVFAEQGAQELSTRAADEFALQLLSDLTTWDPAASFLIFFRAQSLTEADLAELCKSPDPARCLTGLALRRKRGERVAPDRVFKAWAKVPAADRSKLQLLHSLLALGTTDVSR